MVSIPAEPLPDAIARIARRLDGDDDVDELVELIAPSRIVLLGEATHGSHEFYATRAAITRRLIEEHGFTAIAIEGDWPDAIRVDRYVRQLGEDLSADAALAGFERFPTWMWRNREVAELVDWLHDHNARRDTDRVGFYGLDLYSLHASIRAVVSFLDEVDPEAAGRARERYACFDHPTIDERSESRGGGDPAGVARGAGVRPRGIDPQRYGMEAHLGIREDCEDEVVAQLVEQQRRYAARAGRSPGGDAWFTAMVNANVIKNAEAYYRAMFAGRTASWNLRDSHMADTVQLLLDHGVSRLIVWAHNSHVGDARATSLGEAGQLTLGQLVRQRLPDDVALVGFTTHHGTVQCAHDWDEPPHRERVRASLPGSWEQVFHDAGRVAGAPRFAITGEALGRVAGAPACRPHRAIGVVYRPESERQSHYYDARLADQYDLIVHVDTTRAVEPLDRGGAPGATLHDEELPETFPTGV